MNIKQLIEEVQSLPNCIVYPSVGVPTVQEGHELPEDIYQFYTLCGGISLFIDCDYEYHIVPPNNFVLANPVILGQKIFEEMAASNEYKNEISMNWYIVVSDGNGDYLTIDLDRKRLGRCYDSFHETHALIGDTPIIANSFGELLENLIKNRGNYPYWLKDDFISLGDAYDDIYNKLL